MKSHKKISLVVLYYVVLFYVFKPVEDIYRLSLFLLALWLSIFLFGFLTVFRRRSRELLRSLLSAFKSRLHISASQRSITDFGNTLESQEHEMLVLEFCVDQLMKKSVTDSERADYWRLKLNLAVGMLDYQRELLKDKPRNIEMKLSQEEIEQILQEHTLLQYGYTEAPEKSNIGGYMNDVRSKIRNYMDLRTKEPM